MTGCGRMRCLWWRRLMAMTTPHDRNHPIVRTLARLAPTLDYPGGLIGEANYASEWLDCGCCEGSQERHDAGVLEARLANLPALNVSAGLVAALRN